MADQHRDDPEEFGLEEEDIEPEPVEEDDEIPLADIDEED